MIGIAIQVLWLLIGIIALGAIIWVALYVIKKIMEPQPLPPKVDQIVWLVFLLLVLIGVFTLLAGGTIGGYHLGRID